MMWVLCLADTSAPGYMMAHSYSLLAVLQIVFVPGGHGIAFDGPGNKKLATVLTEAYASGTLASMG